MKVGEHSFNACVSGHDRSERGKIDRVAYRRVFDESSLLGILPKVGFTRDKVDQQRDCNDTSGLEAAQRSPAEMCGRKNEGFRARRIPDIVAKSLEYECFIEVF